MTRQEFRELAEKQVLYLDGATGSNLMKAGMPRGVCAESWILEHPEVMKDLQRQYVAAGSQIIYAPTFTANRVYLSQHGLEGRLPQINRALVELSREAAEGRAWIAGDMTTVGTPDVAYEELLEIYQEQARALYDAGVDLFVIETMMGLDETMAALEACRLVCDLPVMCSFSVMGDGQLYFGGNVFDALPQLEEFGADAAGVNCSAGPDQLRAVIRSLANSLHIPVIAKPNAGMPVIDEQGNAVYDMTAGDFAGNMKVLRANGARILGGCCGTDPTYIAALTKKERA